MMLFLADIGLYAFHLLITAFNLFGWIPKRTRKLHRWCVGVTAACWLSIGPLLYGTFGYCPLTDWHWQIKQMRGETDLPNSFITYLFHQIGVFPNPSYVDIAVGVTFAGVIILTIILYVRERRSKIKP